jgi:hypothetical protein
MDAFDLVTLAAFLALSLWTVGVLATQQRGVRSWTGTNGLYLGDQMQYLGWIRDSAQHVLIGDPYKTNKSPHDFLEPGLVISGSLVRLGVSAWLSYLMWVPIAAVALFVAARAYVRSLIAGKAARRFALILALFYISPLAELAGLTHWNQGIFVRSMALEMWPGFYLWGYPLTAIAVALMIGTLITYERDRRDGRVRLWAPMCALFCAWLQPWQGSTLLLIVLAAEALLWWRKQRASLVLPALTAIGALLPLAYYALLGHFDASWALSGRVDFSQGLPLEDLLAVVLPLGVCAAFAYLGHPNTFQTVAVRIWPFGALAVLKFIQLAHVGTFPKHSLQGLSIPLAVLAVIGGQRIGVTIAASSKVILGSILVAVLIGFPVAQQLADARTIANPSIFGSEPYFITPSEKDALDYLNSTPMDGSVLSPVYLGQIVPAETGRKTWVGIFSWTPAYAARVVQANKLFSGQLSPSASIDLVRSSGARFLLADCQDRNDLTPILHSILQSEQHFGCATVYTVRKGPR